MVSSWHRGRILRTATGKRDFDHQYPDKEKVIAAIVPAIEAGESARDALLRIFNVGSNNRFSLDLFRDSRVVAAMKKRAVDHDIRTSSYRKIALKEAERGNNAGT